MKTECIAEDLALQIEVPFENLNEEGIELIVQHSFLDLSPDDIRELYSVDENFIPAIHKLAEEFNKLMSYTKERYPNVLVSLLLQTK
jgi:hypothetical protein